MDLIPCLSNLSQTGCNHFHGFKTHWHRDLNLPSRSLLHVHIYNRCFTSLLWYFTDISYLTYPEWDLKFCLQQTFWYAMLLCFTTYLKTWNISLIFFPFLLTCPIHPHKLKSTNFYSKYFLTPCTSFSVSSSFFLPVF